MINECKKHGLTEFNKNKRCKKCLVEAVQTRRYKIKNMAITYKGGKCQICDYDKYNGALEFHHISNKKFGIGNKGYTKSWKIVKDELDKCILLCSNCHKEFHGGIIDLDGIKNIKIDIEEDKIIDINKCIDCNVEIERKAKRCRKCNSLNKRTVERPSKETLLKDLENMSYLAVGKKYGVSDNTIRKWVK